MTPRTPLIRAGAALAAAAAAATLTLTGCNQAEQSVKDAASGVGDAAKTAASGVGDAAKTAATDAAQTALAPAVNPVLDLLKKGESEVKGGNLAGAVATMGGFKAIWDKAAPVIRPLVGDKWPAIETAANLVLSTFGGGTNPDAATAGSAISGLIGPLSGLLAP
ncbi:MAG: hypothetical protein VKM34_00355 [Cyanobacteriota bacterium]|nr:hypothetical protein [Cyanobacteriota bacterium]